MRFFLKNYRRLFSTNKFLGKMCSLLANDSDEFHKCSAKNNLPDNLIHTNNTETCGHDPPPRKSLVLPQNKKNTLLHVWEKNTPGLPLESKKNDHHDSFLDNDELMTMTKLSKTTWLHNKNYFPRFQYISRKKRITHSTHYHYYISVVYMHACIFLLHPIRIPQKML